MSELSPELENDDFEEDDGFEGEETLDIEALVKKARRSRQINESDVQALLATADEDQADRLYARLQKLDVRVVNAEGEVLNDLGEPSNFLDLDDDDLLADDSGDYLVTAVEDDPVHTYLKEIGQVPLLTAEQEIWLSTQLTAASALENLSLRVAEEGDESEEEVDLRAMTLNYKRLLENEATAKEVSAVIHVAPPEMQPLIAEACTLRRGWQEQQTSYLRDYLNQGIWGQDDAWTDLAQTCFAMFTAVYLLPPDIARKLEEDVRRNGRLPDEDTVYQWLSADKVGLKYNEYTIYDLAEEAKIALTGANLRLVVSVAKRYMGRGIH
ncbi:MAG TPA: sigma-70 factor domain-containing protein, partial [Chloroflexota bacterium]|nr:sigma-70 factor domain-containing protein [Chloroflexota bacterium]